MNWHNKAIKQLTSSSNQDSGVVLPLAFRLIFRICRNEKEIWPELMRIVKSETEKLSWDHTTKDAEWWESLFICSFREHLFLGHLPCDIVLFPMYWVINKRNSPCPCGILRTHPSKKKKKPITSAWDFKSPGSWELHFSLKKNQANIRAH